MRSGVAKRVLRLRGPFDARSDLATECAKVDGFGEKRFGAALQCRALGVGVSISGDHDDRHVGSGRLGLGQKFKPGHPRHVDVGQDQDEKIPSPGEADHGQVLDQEQLASLVQGFRHSALYPIVAIAAFTGARRNEILALRWSDLDPVEKTLRIERALEATKGLPGEGPTRRLKEPKRASHKRTISIDDALVALLCNERNKHLRLKAGVPDGAEVDLSLVRLPVDPLMFPSFAVHNLDFTKLRDANAVTREFERQARKSFPNCASMICAEVMKQPCSTLAYLCMWLPHDVVMIQQCCAQLREAHKKSGTDAANKIGKLLGGALSD